MFGEGGSGLNRSRWVVLSSVVLLILGLTGCTSPRHHQGSAATSTTAVPSTATGSTPSVSSSSPTSVAAAAVTVTTPPATRNLQATPELRAQLLAAFANAKGYPQSDFEGPVEGSVYYAYLAPTGSYWALAAFSLTAAAPTQLGIAMQDGADRGIFDLPPGGAWHVKYGGEPFPCPGELPAPLVTLWGLQYNGGCVTASSTSPARASLSGLPRPSIPAGTYFGTILYFDGQYDGSGYMLFEPETWQGNSPPVSHTRQYVGLQWGPSVQTGFWVGSSPASSHEITGSFDPTFADEVTHAMVPFTTEPYSGYVVTVTNPAGCQGGCSTATDIVQYGPDTPTPPNPGYTEPPS
jgi:hypothetical protein